MCVYLISYKHVYFDKEEIQRRKRSDSEKQLTPNIHISVPVRNSNTREIQSCVRQLLQGGINPVKGKEVLAHDRGLGHAKTHLEGRKQALKKWEKPENAHAKLNVDESFMPGTEEL
jgi:hypothetical protein